MIGATDYVTDKSQISSGGPLLPAPVPFVRFEPSEWLRREIEERNKANRTLKRCGKTLEGR